MKQAPRPLLGGMQIKRGREEEWLLNLRIKHTTESTRAEAIATRQAIRALIRHSGELVEKV